MRILHGVLALSLTVAALGLAHASKTLRVDNQVLVAGDSAGRVIELLGKPVRTFRAARPRSAGRRGGVRVIDAAQGGERWQYRRGDHVTTITLVDGQVVDIDDHRR